MPEFESLLLSHTHTHRHTHTQSEREQERESRSERDRARCNQRLVRRMDGDVEHIGMYILYLETCKFVALHTKMDTSFK